MPQDTVDAAKLSQLKELAPQFAPLVDDLQHERDGYKHERDEYKKLYNIVREQNELLKRGLLGQKAERLPKNDAQLSLAILDLCLGGADAELKATSDEVDPSEKPEQEVAPHTRRKPKRRPLPEHLPRVPIELVPPEVEREGLDAFTLVGVETREVLEYRPASHVVVQLKRKKFKRKNTAPAEPTQVLVSELPELPIERGLAGPGVLADTIVRRWQDHLPLNRLEGIYAREGMRLARSTVCTWHTELAELAQPLITAMKLDAFDAPYLCTDATGVLVQQEEKCRHGHFWVLLAPGKHVLFEYSDRHNGEAVDRLLQGYQGYLVADAHAVYDHLYRSEAIVEVGCWAHCRRYFIKALESEPERAKAALAPIAALFRIERSVATAPRKKREAVRQKKSKSIVEAFFKWCEHERNQVLDESPMAVAIRYALNQRQALSRFVQDGRLPLHNNDSERQLRRQAVGRKNWLFVGNRDGAIANTTFVSLLASCQMHNIEPWSYLRDLLCLLPSWPKSRILELAPLNWKRTLAQDSTQQQLAANVFRRAALKADS